MTDKEKQIIEKAIDILYDLDDSYKNLEREHLENTIRRGGYYDVVKLVKLGYRKIPEGSVVLSLQEHENDIYAAYNRGYERGSKETAREFVNLPDSDILVVDTQEYGEIEVVSVERLQELAKQFGVEVEE